MVVKVPLSGELAQALLPEAGANVAVADSKFSGLVVDAASLPFSPALAPRLLAPDNRVLFSHENVLHIPDGKPGKPTAFDLEIEIDAWAAWNLERDRADR